MWGLTDRKTTSEDSITSRFEPTTVAPTSSLQDALRSGFVDGDTEMFDADATPPCTKPRAMASAMDPAPMNPIRGWISAAAALAVAARKLTTTRKGRASLRVDTRGLACL